MSVANQYRRKRAAALLAAAAVVVAIPANRRAQASTVNGTVAAGEYPAGAIATQNTFTGLGDNFSELNQAFATYAPGGNLELALTGNLEPIGNGLILFIDSRPGGGIANGVGGFNQFGSISGQRIDNWGTDINPAAGVTAPAGGASILAPGFNPEYALEIHNSGGASYFINVIDLTLPNSPSNNRDIFIGSAALNSGLAVTHTYRRDGGATDAGDITSSFNNTNVDGVTDTSAAGAATATKGLELLFENQFLAQTPGHALRILPFITNTDGASLSNQFLPGLGAGIDNPGVANDPAGTPLFDSRAFSERFYIDVFTPTLTAGTSWLTGTWTGGAAPNGAEHSARLTGSSAASVNILAPGVTVGYLDITNPAGYTIGGGGGTLSFNGGAGAAVLFVNSGNQTINSVVNVASDWRVNVASGASVSTAGLSVSAGKVITKVGPGALTFGGATMSSGAGVTLDVQRGTVAVNGNLGSGLVAATTAPDVTVGASAGGSTAVVNFGASQTLKTLKVNADGSANLLANGARAIVANTVVLTGNAKINIADNNMVLKAMPVGTEAGGIYTGVQRLVQLAFNGGAWNGNGITTSQPDALSGLTTLGVASGEQLRGIGPAETDIWNGLTIQGSDTLVMYTYAGDANMDGFISGDDYSTIDFNVGTSADGYSNGDFNYDGLVSGDDYSTIDFNYAAQGAPLSDSAAASVTAVPEPAACAFVFVIAAGTLRRRRRR